MNQTGHRSTAMVRRYIRDGSLFGRRRGEVGGVTSRRGVVPIFVPTPCIEALLALPVAAHVRPASLKTRNISQACGKLLCLLLSH